MKLIISLRILFLVVASLGVRIALWPQVLLFIWRETNL